ncbi:6-phosphogluconate dehydrogenase C-terminal domain-like protein [Hypoxylon trugodes]|uniref:6-phosphogluconate dehydrogenase C-terminal domain-like protein n=1 Tax=Hypoxylon trugodes TaxID=326681 RepID=UPI00219712B9|nr:6-phosphogluconate dehydrogenase C-terminal domain-like protein [Hypoxylon trugodes]KAI1384441.1 6-phosphogluconate dehydrogenase C-terminal domain-like protein [Hypoxylon trugodes]
MPKVLVFGAGALGACYAYVLAKALGEIEVTTVCRSNYDEVARNGFTINSKLWGNNLHFQPRVVRSPAEAAQLLVDGECFEYIIVTSKALTTTPSTPEILAPVVEKGRSAIVLIQNGIGIENEYVTAFPGNSVLSAVAYFPATQVRPGVVEHREVELLHVGTYPPDAPPAHKDVARAFVGLLGQGGATAKLHGDVQRERWVKLLVNAVWNPVCALTRLRDREFIDADRDLRLGSTSTREKGKEEREGDRLVSEMGDGLRFIKDVMLEIASVAQAYGYGDVNEDMVDFQIKRAAVRDLPGVQTSMLTDALAGRAMEVDAVVGNAVRMAREKGIETPMLKTIYVLANGLSVGFGKGS